MARKLEAFPKEEAPRQRRYPWEQWTDEGVWEIRRGEDYDATTENMRVNLHMKADALLIKVRTTKVRDENGEGLVFQFHDPEREEAKMLLAQAEPDDIKQAMNALYHDAIDIYERARKEVMIPRRDGGSQKYAAVRYKQAIDKGHDAGMLVTTVSRIVRQETTGFGHLEAAGRDDLMLENLVIDETKSYHRFFTKKTIDSARERMRKLRQRKPS